MMKINKRDVIGLLFILVPYLIAAYIIVIMPDIVPLDLLEEEVAWKSKSYVAWFCVLLGIVEIGFYCYCIWHKTKTLDRKIGNRTEVINQNNEKYSNYMMLILLIIMSVVNCVVVYLRYKIAIAANIDFVNACCAITCAFLGIVLIVMGNVQPKMLGYKGPDKKKWRDLNPKVIRKINVFTGICLSLCGVVILVIGIVVQGVEAMVVAATLTIVSAVLATIYSYVLSAKDKKAIHRIDADKRGI